MSMMGTKPDLGVYQNKYPGEGPQDAIWSDELGYEHDHQVPAEGQFRLSSCCAGCDQNLVHSTITGRKVTADEADRILTARGM